MSRKVKFSLPTYSTRTVNASGNNRSQSKLRLTQALTFHYLRPLKIFSDPSSILTYFYGAVIIPSPVTRATLFSYNKFSLPLFPLYWWIWWFVIHIVWHKPLMMKNHLNSFKSSTFATSCSQFFHFKKLSENKRTAEHVPEDKQQQAFSLKQQTCQTFSAPQWNASIRRFRITSSTFLY